MSLQSTCAEPWKVLKPEIFAADPHAVYSNEAGEFVVLGDRGLMARSKNLVDWSVEHPNPD
ncbi:MAG: hypothetical protein JNN07_23660, partial [Verrucomicrobiales bacterium]|nr:hypothetical protein [Verrucomicrobiales bacterium]